MLLWIHITVIPSLYMGKYSSKLLSEFTEPFPDYLQLDDFQFFPIFGQVGVLPLWDYFCGTYSQK